MDLVLARKYRPRTFDQMVGQAHVVQALSNALTSGRLHHAYLFTGTRGIGKTTVSRILAKSLNCTGPDGTGGITAQPCGQCQACTEIDADRFIDYIELDAASNRSIDEIRDLIERAAYKPGIGRFKVFMIDEAHQLTKDAFAALLKTLEEPPEYLKFVLATTDADKMLPTVLSRCLQFNLRPMAPEVVHAHLKAVLEAERVPADEAALRLLSRAARGSMRDALSLTDQAIAYGAGKIEEAGVRAMLGTVDRSHAARVVSALAARDGAAVLDVIDGLRQLGLSAAGALEEIAMLLQQMAVEQAVPGALDEHDPDTAGARELSGQLPPDETQLLYSIVVQGRAELSLVSDEYAALTMVLLRLLAFPPVMASPAPQRAAPLQAAPREARARIAPKPAVAPPPKAMPQPARPAPKPADAEPPPWATEDVPDDAVAPRVSEPQPQPALVSVAVQPTALGDRWSDLIRPLIATGTLTGMVRELALQAELIAITQDRWTLRVEREPLRSAAMREKLQAALEIALDLQPGVATDSIALRDAAAREAAQREAQAVIERDPAVRELMAQFATARIVPGSIQPISPARSETP